MIGQRSFLSRGAVILSIAVAAVIVASPLALGAPKNTRVSPVTPTGTDTRPVLTWSESDALTDEQVLVVTWASKPTTSPTSSAVHWARSSNGGSTWTDLGTIPQGAESFKGYSRVAWDTVRKRFYVVTESCFPPAHKCPPNVVFTDDFGDHFSTPNDIWKQIGTDNIEVATHPDIAVDNNASSPFAGRVYVSWTDFNLKKPGSTFVIQSSSDGSTTWTPPIQVSTPGFSYAENGQIEVAPNGDVWAEYMGYDPKARQYRVVVTRSTDGGATWGGGGIALNSIQSTGVLKSCGNAGTKAVLNGDIDSFPVPEFAVSPTNNDLYIVYQAPAPKSNLPDVYFTRSTDGGKTWSKATAIGSGPRDQWAPSMDVGPNGEIGVAYYSRQNSTANVNMDLYMRFSTNRGTTFGAAERVSSVSSKPPKLNPNYETWRRNCESPLLSDTAFPGSGAYVAWVDTRDKGPTGNNGVDPNIYFAHVPIPTTTSAVVVKAATTVGVSGAVSPAVPGGKVTATLYRKVGSKFAKVTDKTATLNASSKYALSFTRTAAGSCQVIVKFAGNPEYLASNVTKPFTC